MNHHKDYYLAAHDEKGHLRHEMVDRLPLDLSMTITSEGLGTEPDFIIASIEYNGFIGYVRRNPLFWSLCGYVIIPDWYRWTEGRHISCHWGITMEGKDLEDRFVLGFDCAHAGDLTPSNIILLPHYLSEGLQKWDTYRPLDYVIYEIMGMIDQL